MCEHKKGLRLQNRLTTCASPHSLLHLHHWFKETADFPYKAYFILINEHEKGSRWEIRLPNNQDFPIKFTSFISLNDAPNIAYLIPTNEHKNGLNFPQIR